LISVSRAGLSRASLYAALLWGGLCGTLIWWAMLAAPDLAEATSPQILGKSLGKIKAVHVTGLKRYSQPEVLSVAGLVPGQIITEDDLKDTITVLGKTGAFSSLTYSYSTLAGTVKVELQLTETDKLLPVRFDNFVWWPDDDLRAKLRERVLLFRDQLPAVGTLADTVADALQAIISERQLPGHVTYSRYDVENGPVEAFIYQVENISLTTGSIDFPGAGPEESPALQEAARKQLLGKQYRASEVEIVASIDFRNVYLRRGYLQVAFDDPSVAAPPPPANQSNASESTQNESAGDANSVRVTVHLPVRPGLQFRMANVDWTGNQAFPASELQNLITVPAGQPANTLQLKENLEQVVKLYGTRGYLEARCKLEAHLDGKAKTASFSVQIAEGAVFHFGELSIEGLDPKITARVREQWTLRSGDPFDTGYEAKFLKEALRSLPPGRWSSVENHLNEADKTVDVALRYATASN
jgi:outer membrane protein assembly factor BamA